MRMTRTSTCEIFKKLKKIRAKIAPNVSNSKNGEQFKFVKSSKRSMWLAFRRKNLNKTFSLITSMRDFIQFKQDLEHYLRIDSLNYQREHIEQQYKLIRRERIQTVCNIPHSKFNWLHNIRWPWIAKIISIDFIIPLSEFKNKILNICRLMRLTHSVWLVDDESYRNWIQSNRVAPAQFALVPELQYSQNKFSPCPSSYTNLYHNHI